MFLSEINKDWEENRQVETATVETLANEYEIEFREISANNKKEVDEVFMLLIELIIKNYNFSDIPTHSFVLTRDPDMTETFVEESEWSGNWAN